MNNSHLKKNNSKKERGAPASGSAKGDQGFTLVEVLVALSIFSVAVSGVISVAAQGGLTANIVKFKVEATYLADEGIELTRALRDTTVLDWQTVYPGSGPAGVNPYNMWKVAFIAGASPIVGTYCTIASPCDIDIRNADPAFPTNPFPQVPNIVSCGGVGTLCPLYYDDRVSLGGVPVDVGTYGYYLNNSLGGALRPSPFSRSIVIEPIPSQVTGMFPEEVKVTVTVSWHEGSNVKTLTQTEHLFAWYR